jgi:hypothetical protein
MFYKEETIKDETFILSKLGLGLNRYMQSRKTVSQQHHPFSSKPSVAFSLQSK